jgi:hypothetical protein
MTEGWNGQSEVRLLWRRRLVETVWVPTSIPLEAVVNDNTFSPLPTFDAVQTDEVYEAAIKSVVDRLPSIIDTLLLRHAEPGMGDVLLTWVSYQVKSAPSLLAARRDSLVERIASLPLLRDSVDEPLSLRDVATMVLRHGQCRYVPNDTRGRPAEESQRLARATERVLECLRRLFDDVVDASHLLQRTQWTQKTSAPVGASPTVHMLHRVTECLSAWHGRSTEARGDDADGVLVWDEDTSTVVFNQKHPHVRRLLNDPHASMRTQAALATLALSRSSGGSVVRELDIMAHVTEWLLSQAGY